MYQELPWLHPDRAHALIDALSDNDNVVQRTALGLLGELGTPQAVDAIAKILSQSPDWALRLHAAKAIGRMPQTKVPAAVVETLAGKAQRDDYALVRQAAMESLAQIAPNSAKTVATLLAKNDPEPQVRETAQKVLQ